MLWRLGLVGHIHERLSLLSGQLLSCAVACGCDLLGSASFGWVQPAGTGFKWRFIKLAWLLLQDILRLAGVTSLWVVEVTVCEVPVT